MKPFDLREASEIRLVCSTNLFKSSSLHQPSKLNLRWWVGLFVCCVTWEWNGLRHNEMPPERSSKADSQNNFRTSLKKQSIEELTIYVLAIKPHVSITFIQEVFDIVFLLFTLFPALVWTHIGVYYIIASANNFPRQFVNFFCARRSVAVRM